MQRNIFRCFHCSQVKPFFSLCGKTIVLTTGEAVVLGQVNLNNFYRLHISLYVFMVTTISSLHHDCALISALISNLHDKYILD